MNSAIRTEIQRQDMHVEHVGGLLVLKQGRKVIMHARTMKEIGSFMRGEEAHVRAIARDERARIEARNAR